MGHPNTGQKGRGMQLAFALTGTRTSRSISPYYYICLSHIHNNKYFCSVHMLMIFFNLRRNPVQLLFLTSSKGQGSTKRTLVAAGECRSRSICPESIQALSSPPFFFSSRERKNSWKQQGRGRRVRRQQRASWCSGRGPYFQRLHISHDTFDNNTIPQLIRCLVGSHVM